MQKRTHISNRKPFCIENTKAEEEEHQRQSITGQIHKGTSYACNWRKESFLENAFPVHPHFSTNLRAQKQKMHQGFYILILSNVPFSYDENVYNITIRPAK